MLNSRMVRLQKGQNLWFYMASCLLTPARMMPDIRRRERWFIQKKSPPEWTQMASADFGHGYVDQLTSNQRCCHCRRLQVPAIVGEDPFCWIEEQLGVARFTKGDVQHMEATM